MQLMNKDDGDGEDNVGLIPGSGGRSKEVNVFDAMSDSLTLRGTFAPSTLDSVKQRNSTWHR